MNNALSAMAALPILGWSVHAAALRHRLTQARRDPLTHLPTRDQYTTHAARLLRHQPALVVLIDLDRFKPLNDTHGHAAGDTALRQVAHRLALWAQRDGLAARLGGDEFTAILPNPTDPRAELAALHTALTRPIAHQEQWLDLGASIGGFLAAPGTPIGRALSVADAAMYQAKTCGGGWHLNSGEADPSRSIPRRWHRNHPAPVKETA
ncbi:MAG TPA: GGDEF domain-containing protein [Actinocrinis sp.]|uniref:GGDEF domain-containing protein n=1 Tax=Actinocrinis sp. TaxID=1920516 RepID=UPI002DDCCA37|nr:GGDEF domain-containing protein [Actinocrinis sp.]HEV2345370.1 GGDEF domain-containing protein [Actinocrinis sp.]